jgi:pyruvate dehydrogenase E2 component (dihydrolipoamide acetyltransferase)
MPFTVTMPKLSPTMELGTIVKWHKKVGEKVESEELLLEIATDKTTVEHNALDEGWLREILVKEGEEAQINQPIAIFTVEKDESIEGYKPEEIFIPKEETKLEEVSLAEKEAKVEEKIVGTLRQPVFIPEPPLSEYAFDMPREAINKRIKATPLARKLAKQKGLDLSTVKGTGPGGRIVSQDLARAQKGGLIVFGRREIPDLFPGVYEEEALTPMRRVIAQRLQEAKTFIPHFYVQQTVNASLLIQAREQLHEMQIQISINDCVVKACALALREHPNVNSGFNSANGTIIRFKTIDIAVAVSVDEGLITPIIRHADYKNLGEISLEIRNLAKRARDGQLEMHEYKGGSFTISNLGMYGVTDFQAIINPPQAAILAVSAIQNVPIVKDGQVVPGKIMNLSLSCDHRVIDGVVGAKFIKTIQKYLENPAVLLI